MVLRYSFESRWIASFVTRPHSRYARDSKGRMTTKATKTTKATVGEERLGGCNASRVVVDGDKLSVVN